MSYQLRRTSFYKYELHPLLATTQAHHLPYLDISQTQQPYIELSKDLNIIHAYGTLPLSIDLNKEYKCWNTPHSDMAQLVEQLVLQSVSPDSSPAAASVFGPSK